MHPADIRSPIDLYRWADQFKKDYGWWPSDIAVPAEVVDSLFRRCEDDHIEVHEWNDTSEYSTRFVLCPDVGRIWAEAA